MVEKTLASIYLDPSHPANFGLKGKKTFPEKMFNIGWVNRMFILSIIGLNLPERTVREVVLSFTLKMNTC